jgi:D-cysteine desulfhydrase
MLTQLEKRPRFNLLDGRTPIQRLTRLEQVLDCSGCPPIYVKRDDLMGSGGAATSSQSWSS